MLKKNNYRKKDQNRRMIKLEDQMDTVFGHISATNEELASVKTDVSWLKRHYWIVATASIGGLVGVLINLLLK